MAPDTELLELTNWAILSREGRSVLDEILSEWQILLQNKNAKELEYQVFLEEHAGFFWCDNNQTEIVISQLRLGANYVTDFVCTQDLHSLGFAYELIEIESPHSPPYNQDGTPSARLTHAIQQVENWRQWLTANRSEAKRLFPSWEFWAHDTPLFSYTVVIGTRDNSKKWKHLRNNYGQRLAIQIRSFDYLTDRFQSKLFGPLPGSRSVEMDRWSLRMQNEFENPFYIAYTDREWREIATNNDITPYHIVGNNLEVFLKYRKYNPCLEQFVSIYAQLPDETKIASLKFFGL